MNSTRIKSAIFVDIYISASEKSGAFIMPKRKEGLDAGRS